VLFAICYLRLGFGLLPFLMLAAWRNDFSELRRSGTSSFVGVFHCAFMVSCVLLIYPIVLNLVDFYCMPTAI